MTDPCPCGHDAWAVPVDQSEALALAGHQNAVGHLLEVVARDNARWLGVLRCSRCGRLWAEDSMSSGHADMFFIYPIGASDAAAWLATARPLNPPSR